MLNILIFINIGIFVLLSVLHIYWALGGSWAVEFTIPDKFKDTFHNPSNRLGISISTFVVAFGLLAFAFITASNYFNFENILKHNWTSILTKAIAAIFILRAIGDFNLFGIFKSKSDSKFAIKDRQIYVPLCLYLGMSSLVIAFLNL